MAYIHCMRGQAFRRFVVVSTSICSSLLVEKFTGACASVYAYVQMAQRIAALADGGWNTYVTDAQRGYTIVLVAGPVAALVICLLYMVFMRFFAGATHAICIISCVNQNVVLRQSP